MKHLSLALTMGLLAASCGDSDGGGGRDTGNDMNPDQTGGDGDGQGDGDGPGPGPGNSGSDGLMINAALGLEVIDHPPEGETNLERQVLVTRGNESALSPMVTVNGVEFEEDSFLKNFFGAPQGSLFDDIGPSKTLRISAVDAKGETSLELPCPDDAKITAPKAHDTVRSGDTLTVSWSGDIHAHNVAVLTPSVQFHRPNEFNGKWTPISNATANIEKGETSVEITIPEVTGEQLIALQLHVPGPFISPPNSDSGQNAGVCWLVRRIELNVTGR